MRVQQHSWCAAVALAALLLPGHALAWDQWTSWYQASDGMTPGGGGIIGTGSASDYGITCANCHIESKGKLTTEFVFNPALTSVGNADTYAPGTTYTVTVKILAEALGVSGCKVNTVNSNGFAATVEDSAGKLAGILASDSGQSKGACPKTIPTAPAGTTFMMDDCDTVISAKQDATTTWTFSWKAPSAGAGELTVYYAAVDGNCDMSSRNDDVKVTSFKLGEAVVRNDRRPDQPRAREFLAMLGILPIAAMVIGRRRRKIAPK